MSVKKWYILVIAGVILSIGFLVSTINFASETTIKGVWQLRTMTSKPTYDPNRVWNDASKLARYLVFADSGVIGSSDGSDVVAYGKYEFLRGSAIRISIRDTDEIYNIRIIGNRLSLYNERASYVYYSSELVTL